MDKYIEPQRSQWVDLITRPSGHDEQQESLVETILDQVKSQGDIALKIIPRNLMALV